jgi:hypothetical protein
MKISERKLRRVIRQVISESGELPPPVPSQEEMIMRRGDYYDRLKVSPGVDEKTLQLAKAMLDSIDKLGNDDLKCLVYLFESSFPGKMSMDEKGKLAQGFLAMLKMYVYRS